MYRFADLLNVRVPTFYDWQRVGRIPAERCLDVERLTGVPRHIMRPDVYGDAGAAA